MFLLIYGKMEIMQKDYRVAIGSFSLFVYKRLVKLKIRCPFMVFGQLVTNFAKASY